jgi:hypothetical protein
MNLLDRLAEMTKAVLTTDAELRHQREMLSEMRQEVGKLTGGLQDVRERVTRWKLCVKPIAHRMQRNSPDSKWKWNARN